MDTLKEKDEDVQELIKHLQVFEVVCSKIHKCFVPKVILFKFDLCTRCYNIIFNNNYFVSKLFLLKFIVYKLIFF